MIEREDATLTTIRCDMPHCDSQHESFSTANRWAEWPQEWKKLVVTGVSRMDAGPDDLVLLCPAHAPLADSLALAVHVTRRLAERATVAG